VRAESSLALAEAGSYSPHVAGSPQHAVSAGDKEPYRTIAEAGELARVSPSTIRLYVRKRQLRAQRVGPGGTVTQVGFGIVFRVQSHRSAKIMAGARK
jgi:hypothetical protein